jgi:hypothetical protein
MGFEPPGTGAEISTVPLRLVPPPIRAPRLGRYQPARRGTFIMTRRPMTSNEAAR